MSRGRWDVSEGGRFIRGKGGGSGWEFDGGFFGEGQEEEWA